MSMCLCGVEDQRLDTMSWMRVLASCNGCFVGKSQRYGSSLTTLWQDVRLFTHSIHHEQRTATLEGVGMSLFNNQPVPFTLLGTVKDNTAVFEKTMLYNGITVSCRYKITFNINSSTNLTLQGNVSHGVLQRIY
jgi:hypothetical protein